MLISWCCFLSLCFVSLLSSLTSFISISSSRQHWCRYCHHNTMRIVLLILFCCVFACESRSIGSRGGAFGGGGRYGSLSGGKISTGSRSVSGIGSSGHLGSSGRFGTSIVTRAIFFNHIASHGMYGSHMGHYGHSNFGSSTQLRCIGGSNNCTFQPNNVQCYNKTSGSNLKSWQWQCESNEMDMTSLCFNTVTVTCNDSRIDGTRNGEASPTPSPITDPGNGNTSSSGGMSKRETCWMEYTIDRIRISIEGNGSESSEEISACSGTHYDVVSDGKGTLLVCLLIFCVLCIVCFLCCLLQKTNDGDNEKSPEPEYSYQKKSPSVDPPVSAELHPLTTSV